MNPVSIEVSKQIDHRLLKDSQKKSKILTFLDW